MLLAEASAGLGLITPLLSTLIVGLFLVVILAMLKSFITHGISIAVTEWLLKMSDVDQQGKVTRWFANGEQIQEHLKTIRLKLEAEKAE